MHQRGVSGGVAGERDRSPIEVQGIGCDADAVRIVVRRLHGIGEHDKGSFGLAGVVGGLPRLGPDD